MLNIKERYFLNPLSKISFWEKMIDFLMPFKDKNITIQVDNYEYLFFKNYNSSISLVKNINNIKYINKEKIIKYLLILEKEAILIQEKFDNILNEKEIDFYKNNIIFLENFFWDDWIKLQEKLKNKKISIIWVGWTWTWLLLNLIWSWIWEIRIIDSDIVELSNIPRQILFETKDIWKYKVEVAKEFIEKRNPFIEIKIDKNFVSKENYENIKKILIWSDLIINAWDKPTRTELWNIIQDLSFDLNIPFCSWAYSSWIIFPLVIPWKTSCLNCLQLYINKNLKISNNRNNNFIYTSVPYYNLYEKNSYVSREIIKFFLMPESCELINYFIFPWNNIRTFLKKQKNCLKCKNN